MCIDSVGMQSAPAAVAMGQPAPPNEVVALARRCLMLFEADLLGRSVRNAIQVGQGAVYCCYSDFFASRLGCSFFPTFADEAIDDAAERQALKRQYHKIILHSLVQQKMSPPRAQDLPASERMYLRHLYSVYKGEWPRTVYDFALEEKVVKHLKGDIDRVVDYPCAGAGPFTLPDRLVGHLYARGFLRTMGATEQEVEGLGAVYRHIADYVSEATGSATADPLAAMACYPEKRWLSRLRLQAKTAYKVAEQTPAFFRSVIDANKLLIREVVDEPDRMAELTYPPFCADGCLYEAAYALCSDAQELFYDRWEDHLTVQLCQGIADEGEKLGLGVCNGWVTEWLQSPKDVIGQGQRQLTGRQRFLQTLMSLEMNREYCGAGEAVQAMHRQYKATVLDNIDMMLELIGDHELIGDLELMALPEFDDYYPSLVKVREYYGFQHHKELYAVLGATKGKQRYYRVCGERRERLMPLSLCGDGLQQSEGGAALLRRLLHDDGAVRRYRLSLDDHTTGLEINGPQGVIYFGDVNVGQFHFPIGASERFVAFLGDWLDTWYPNHNILYLEQVFLSPLLAT